MKREAKTKTKAGTKTNKYPIKLRVTYERTPEYYQTIFDLTKEDYEKRINNGQEGHRLFSSERCFSFRDGKIKLNLKFLSNCNDESWAGIFFRASDNPWRGGYLFYIRKNGSVELAEYPQGIIEVSKIKLNQLSENEMIEVELEIENDEWIVKIRGRHYLFARKLKNQSHGHVFLHTCDCRAEFSNIELIDRDTIHLGED